ncbi:MAG: DUF445 domain-containing protein [Micromonosporaceae bacterium]
MLVDLGRELADHWLLYASIPFIAAAIGYVTKYVAVEMMFRPLEFKGIRPFLGWQGVLPANAGRMAATAMDLLLGRLIDPHEILRRLDPHRLVREVEEPLKKISGAVGEELLREYQADLWEMTPGPVQRLIIGEVRRQAPDVARKLLPEIIDNIEEYVDVRDMAISNLIRDKATLNRLIRDVAKPEMDFIIRSGIYFGFGLGLIQVIVWALTHQPLVMPLFGLFVGGATDWIALKMIFLPREPKRFFGFFGWQGMFQKRRKQVAADYGRLIADEVLTVPSMVEGLLTGPKSDRLFKRLESELRAVVDARLSLAKPLVVLMVGGRRFQEMKHRAVERAIQEMPETMRPAMDYAKDALDVRHTIIDKMLQLSPLEYEGILRPAFKQDEWKLITVGATIGFLVGELQVILLLE